MHRSAGGILSRFLHNPIICIEQRICFFLKYLLVNRLKHISSLFLFSKKNDGWRDTADFTAFQVNRSSWTMQKLQTKCTQRILPSDRPYKKKLVVGCPSPSSRASAWSSLQSVICTPLYYNTDNKVSSWKLQSSYSACLVSKNSSKKCYSTRHIESCDTCMEQ